MTTKQYHYFITIADKGSISAAAASLNVSVSALSKFLKKLQTSLGAELFIQQNKNLCLTEQGKICYDAACKILTIQNNMMQAVRQRKGTPDRVMRVAVPPNMGFETYSRTLHRFLSLFPNETIEVIEMYSKDQEAAIRSRSIDLAFGAGCHEGDSSVKNIHIGKMEIFLAASRQQKMPGSVSEKTGSVSLKDFSTYSFVLCDQQNNVRKEADRCFTEAGYHPIVTFQSPNPTSVEYMIRSGVGIGFLSSKHVKYSDPDLLFYHLIPPCYENYYMRYHSDHTLTVKEKCLTAIYTQEHIRTTGSEYADSSEITEFLETVKQESERRTIDRKTIGQSV